MTRLNSITTWCIASLFLVLALPGINSAQITGPSTAQSPYLVPVYSGVQFTSILSANDSINHYKMCGTPDGLGVLDNGDGTFTLFMNHEFTNTQGVNRAHGSKGSFVSKWIINKQDLSVVSGSDEIQNVYLWDNTTSTYTLYNAANPSTLSIFQRLCSADMPPVSAFYNSATGNGTQERIYMNGEEVSDGRAMAHIVTGQYAGTSWQLPWFGKLAWENSVANATEQDKTIVAGLDDASITTANVYFYVGTKTNSGTDIDKAGLNNGTMYAVKVSGFPQERVSSSSINNPPAPGTHFDLVNIGSVLGLTGAQMDANSLAAGATYFSRVEDGSWDPSNLSDFYFQTTDQIDQVNDGLGTQVGRPRVWHLHFTDIANPELGGTIEAVLDGTEGPNMLDNLTVGHGHTVNLEDVGNSAHNGKIWDYNIATDVLTQIAKHDPARFGDILIPATSPFNQDEETSGVIDVQSLLGPGMYLLDDQAHYLTGIPVDVVEGGQLDALYNPRASDCSNYSASVSPTGSVNFCSNTDVTLRANGGYGFTYQWYKNGATIVGATNATYATNKKGDYYVVESNGTCSWTSSVTSLTKLTAPQASIVANNGLDLCTNGTVSLKAVGGSSNSSYAWTKDEVDMAGVATKKIVVSEAGEYSVTITNTNGCSSEAEDVTVVQSCKESDGALSVSSSVNIYPNPSNGVFMIAMNLQNDYSGITTVQIMNELGQVIYQHDYTAASGNIHQEIKFDQKLQAGNYYVKVIAGSEVIVKQLVYQP